jgi:hypothetical protein
MGEVWTTMKIGGAVPPDKVEEFKSIAKGDFPDDIDGDAKELVDGAIADKTALTLSGTCNFGDADELEAACRRWGLS